MSEPTPEQLWKQLERLQYMQTLLEPQWSTRSSSGQLRSIETMLASLRQLTTATIDMFCDLSPNCSEPHPRPEDCCCPACRAVVDRWSLEHAQLVALPEHPKSNPYPSERELAHAWTP